MVGSGWGLFDLQESVEFGCEHGSELQSSVGDDSGGEAVVLPDVVAEQVSST